jgi:hypothetical protein
VALLGRAYGSQELCGIAGIDDVEAHVRHALDDYMHRNGMVLNGRYDDALKDLISTTIVETIPGFDALKGLSLSTFVYRRINQRNVTQWLRDNVRDTRYGRHCPDCAAQQKAVRAELDEARQSGADTTALRETLARIRISDTAWIGSDRRQCRRCGLVYDDYKEELLGDDDRELIGRSLGDFTTAEVHSLVNSVELAPTTRQVLQRIVLPMMESGQLRDKRRLSVADIVAFNGMEKNRARQILNDLRRDLECRLLQAA